MITPGPWHISRHATPEHSPQFGVYAEGQSRDHIIVTGANAAHDAAAVATLPELIEALTVLVERIDQWSADNPGNAGMYHAMTAEARQALRSATQ